MKYAIVLACVFAVISIVTYVLYAVDKRRAQKKQWRIPEATLITFSLLGGAIGGYFAMQTKRHKTKHWYFHFFNLLGLIWQIGLLIFLIIKF